MMNFIAHNWLWFGMATVIVLILAVLNFLRAARASMSLNASSFKQSICAHLVIGLLFFVSAVPFAIGAVIAIIKYVQAQ